jgi:RNA polymerase sigma factor (sigma-70 family)
MTYRQDDSVHGLISHVRNLPPTLTRDEEQALARRVRDGDEAARTEFIERNVRLVVSTAKKFQGRGLDLEDLIAEGMFGLMTAVDKFDPDRGNRFSTMAVPWIKQTIGRAAQQSDTIRMPHSGPADSAVPKAWREVDGVWQDVPVPPRVTRSLDKPIGDSDSSSLGDLYADATYVGEDGGGETAGQRTTGSGAFPTTGPVESCVLESEEFVSLTDAVASLSLLHRQIIELRFGIDSELDPLNLTQVAGRLNITPADVRRLEDEALAFLREHELVEAVR